MTPIDLSKSDKGELLRILPIKRINDDATNNTRSLYIAKARGEAEQFSDEFPVNLLTTVVKNDFNRRLAQAKRDRAELSRNPAMKTEYDQELWPIENKLTPSPTERMNAFVGLTRLLPSFEVAVRLRLEKQFANQKSLIRSILETYSDHPNVAILHDEPVTRIKVPRVIHDKMGDYAVIETKTDGMTLSHRNEQIKLKQRTMGVVALNKIGFGEFRRSLTMLANVYEDIKDDELANECKEAALEGIGESDAYLNVIERVYATRG